MISYHTCPLATLGGKDTGGMNVYVRELTRALGRRGIGVDVFTRSQDEHVPHVIHDLGYGNRVIHVPAGPEGPQPRELLHEFLPEFVVGIQKFADQDGSRYDLIHSHYWLSALAARPLRAAWQVPLVHMFHTLGIMKARIGDESENPGRVEAERQILGWADRVVAATPAERAQLQWLYSADLRRVVVIPPGVDTDRFHPMPMQEAKRRIDIDVNGQMLLFVGRIERLKGIETLLRAAALLRAQKKIAGECGCVVVIGGDAEAPEEEMDRLQDLCRQLGVLDLVTFVGKRSQDTLPYYYSAAHVVVCPSHYESFGMVALEAMACGTPVVASGVGGLLYLVRDGVTGFHVPDRDPQALAAKLAAILEHEELRRELGRQAASAARSYDWRLIANQVMTVYESVLARKELIELGSNRHGAEIS
jgi:D-inositol-3-phosphate glycosyltransferase